MCDGAIVFGLFLKQWHEIYMAWNASSAVFPALTLQFKSSLSLLSVFICQIQNTNIWRFLHCLIWLHLVAWNFINYLFSILLFLTTMCLLFQAKVFSKHFKNFVLRASLLSQLEFSNCPLIRAFSKIIKYFLHFN